MDILSRSSRDRGSERVLECISCSITILNTTTSLCPGIELETELLRGQLHSYRMALTQVQHLITENGSVAHIQPMEDLSIAIGHLELPSQRIYDQISKLTPISSDLSAARILLTEPAIHSNMMLLSSQIAALNVCLTAFKCRTDAELPQHPASEIVELPPPNTPDAEETPSIKLAQSYMAYPPQVDLTFLTKSRSYSSPAVKKKFDLERLFTRSQSYGGHHTRSDSDGSHESSSSNPTVKNTMSKLSSALMRSAKVDQAIRRDSMTKDKRLRIVAYGQHPATLVKRLRYAISGPPSAEEIEQGRRQIIPYVVGQLLAFSKTLENTMLTSENMMRLAYTQDLEFFESDGEPDWIVSQSVFQAALSIWNSNHVQECFKVIDQETPVAYFMRATQRIMHPHYTPSITDMVKIRNEPRTVTEANLVIDDVQVDLIDVPQPKLRKLIRHHEDANAFLVCLNLSTYNQYSYDSNQNDLERTMNRFRRNCRPSKLSGKPVLLLMYNTGAFRRKLTVAPLRDHFEDCKKIKSYDDAVKWVLKRFRAGLHETQRLLHHFSEDDADDDSTVPFFKQSVALLPQFLNCARMMDELSLFTA